MACAPRPYLEELVGADEEGVPVVSAGLGVDHFGQSGLRADLYRHYGIDAGAMARAARVLLGALPSI